VAQVLRFVQAAMVPGTQRREDMFGSLPPGAQAVTGSQP
jgi:hypothetical protein